MRIIDREAVSGWMRSYEPALRAPAMPAKPASRKMIREPGVPALFTRLPLLLASPVSQTS